MCFSNKTDSSVERKLRWGEKLKAVFRLLFGVVEEQVFIPSSLYLFQEELLGQFFYFDSKKT